MYPKAHWWMMRSASNEYQKAYDNIVRFIPKCGSLLDVGCGTGELLKRIRAAKKAKNLFGLDISNELLELASYNLSNYGVTLWQDDILYTRLPENSFDCITFTFPAIVASKTLLSKASPVEVMSVLLYRVLDNISSLLRKGGRFMQVEFDGFDYNPDEAARAVYEPLCREHGLSLESIRFCHDERIASDVDLKKQAAYRGYVIAVSKKI